MIHVSYRKDKALLIPFELSQKNAYTRTYTHSSTSFIKGTDFPWLNLASGNFPLFIVNTGYIVFGKPDKLQQKSDIPLVVLWVLSELHVGLSRRYLLPIKLAVIHIMSSNKTSNKCQYNIFKQPIQAAYHHHHHNINKTKLNIV